MCVCVYVKERERERERGGVGGEAVKRFDLETLRNSQR